MNKRERLEKTIAGEKTDRIPIAFWRHWPGDDQDPENLAWATLAFQQRWDFDFIKASPSSSYCLRDYGIEDHWVGNTEGTRDYAKRVVVESDDWAKLPKLDPKSGSLGLHLETLRLIKAGLDDETPVIFTIFSPIAQAKNLSGADKMVLHMRQNPGAFKAGIDILAENTMRYLDALAETGIDGIFYAVQRADYATMSAAEYHDFGRTFDLKILESMPDSWWFNMVHLHGNHAMFDMVADYPVQALNWHDRETAPNLKDGMARFKGAVCGGLGRWDMHNGTPDDVRAQARDAIDQTGGRRFILSTGCVMITTTPKANIRAAVDLAKS